MNRSADDICKLSYDDIPTHFKVGRKIIDGNYYITFNNENTKNLNISECLEFSDIKSEIILNFSSINKGGEKLDIGEELLIKEIKFRNCKNLKIEFLRKSYIPKVTFIDCQIDKIRFSDTIIGTTGIIFSGNSSIDRFEMANTIVNSILKIEEINNINFFEIKNCRFIFEDEHKRHNYERSLIFARSKITYLTLENVDFSDNGVAFIHTEITNGLVTNMSKLGDLSFEGRWPKDSSLTIENCECSNLSFVKFKNFGELSFVTIKNNNNDGELRIHTSDLGKIQFIDCNFSKWRYSFKDSKIIDTLIISCELPIQSVHIKNERYGLKKSIKLFFSSPLKYTKRGFLNKQKNDYSQQRSLYSQLQKSFDNNGDKVKSILYQRLSADAYRMQLLYSKNPKNLRQWADLFSLFVNKYSNEYGYRLSRVTKVFLITSIILYTLFLNEVNKICTCSIDWGLVWQWFEFINPVHKIDFLGNNILIPPTARFIDGISRIIIAYLLYQFVQSFRKFGRN